MDLSLIDAYQEYRSRQKVRGEKIGPTQKYHDISLLKRFLLWCADRKMTLDNPLANQKFSKPTPKRRGSSPTMEQVNTILPALPPRIHAPVAVLAFGGMRSANCRQLLIEDVDLDEGWIHVRSREGAESKVGNEWKVPIHPRLADVLRAAPWPKSGYLFTAPPSRKYPKGGHWISTKHLNEDFVKVLKKLAIPSGRKTGFTIHSLRRFFKSFCISHGVPREYVDAWQVTRASDPHRISMSTRSTRTVSDL